MMDTASITFVVFGLGVAGVLNLNRSPFWRTTVLLVGSFVFIALQVATVSTLVPLAGFVLLGYLGLRVISAGSVRLRPYCIGTVVLAYLWLKKYTFLPESSFLPKSYFTLGLSYIFFRVLHLLIEHPPEGAGIRIGPVRYLTYLLNFTTFVAGPIQRYDEFARDQFAPQPLELTGATVGKQLERMVLGFFKVNVLALLFDMVHSDSLAQLSQPVPLLAKGCAALRLVLSYPFFLYNNFSGYIDMVLALACLLRIRLPENFDRPFSATSFLEFWNRWHITLSTWLKTYVYNSLLLTLARRTPSVAGQQYLGVLCFFVTFFLVGLWHGRTSEFLVFGVLQGGGVALNKMWQISLTSLLGRKGYKALAARTPYVVLARGLTFTWFTFTLTWFWGDWAQISTVARALPPAAWLVVWLLVWSSAAVVLAAWERVRGVLVDSLRSRESTVAGHCLRIASATALLMCALALSVALGQPAPDIVYKAF
jgi:alginate O-acetyltransferase complex protein AlgI